MGTLKINGEEYKVASDWTITQKSGNPSASTFRVLVESGQHVPEQNDLVLFTAGTDTLFTGVVGIPKGNSFSTGNELRLYTLTCNSANSLLSRRLPNVSYANRTLSYIVNDLFNEYIAGEGCTLGRIEVSNEPTFDIYNSNQIGLDKLLDELAEYVSAVWEITSDKVFNFYSADTVPSRTVSLTADTAALSSVQPSTSSNTIRTRQIIEGCTNETSTQTSTFNYAEDSYTFVVIYPLAYQPAIYINGTAVSAEEIGVKNFSVDDPTVLFYWSYNSTEVNINHSYTGTTTLSAGDAIKIEYIGMIDVRIEVDNASKIEELAKATNTSGIIENYYNDTSLKTPEDAYKKANALLLQHGNNKHTLTATTTSDVLASCGFSFADTEVGSQWIFDLPDLAISGNYVVTERKIQQSNLAEEQSYKLALTWTDTDYSGGYATTLSDMESAITGLQVREDLKIIKYTNTEERTVFGEQTTWENPIINYVCVNLENGQIATPLGTLYPYLID